MLNEAPPVWDQMQIPYLKKEIISLSLIQDTQWDTDREDKKIPSSLRQ
jgi:hypothetical protein